MRIDDSDGIRVLHLPDDGPLISTPEESSDLIGNAWVEGAGMIALPVSRIDPTFFRLGSGFAGEFLQKMVNYRMRLAVIGDISEFEAGSSTFRDFVRESNRGSHVWFVRDEDALRVRLAARRR